MPVDARLLEILCCPVSRVPVEVLAPDRLSRLNEAIRQGGVRYADGSAVEAPLEEALITEDGATVYVVDRGTPVMLAEKGIKTDALFGHR